MPAPHPPAAAIDLLAKPCRAWTDISQIEEAQEALSIAHAELAFQDAQVAFLLIESLFFHAPHIRKAVLSTHYEPSVDTYYARLIRIEDAQGSQLDAPDLTSASLAIQTALAPFAMDLPDRVEMDAANGLADLSAVGRAIMGTDAFDAWTSERERVRLALGTPDAATASPGPRL